MRPQNAGSGLSLTTYEASSGLFPGRVVALGDGSELLVSGLLTVQQTLTSTMLGACGGALVGMGLSYVFAFHVIDLGAIVNCLLAGLVSITAGCATFYPYISLLVGMVGAAVYMGASRAMVWLRIDDPLDAVAIHGACGLWGLLAVGLFSARDAQAAAGFRATHYGAAFGGGWRLLACQAVGAVFVIGWTTVTTVPLWYSLRALGLLRVTPEEEMDGLDEGLHGGTAYPIDESYTPWHSPTPPPRHRLGVTRSTQSPQRARRRLTWTPSSAPFRPPLRRTTVGRAKLGHPSARQPARLCEVAGTAARRSGCGRQGGRGIRRAPS